MSAAARGAAGYLFASGMFNRRRELQRRAAKKNEGVEVSTGQPEPLNRLISGPHQTEVRDVKVTYRKHRTVER